MRRCHRVRLPCLPGGAERLRFLDGRIRVRFGRRYGDFQSGKLIRERSHGLLQQQRRSHENQYRQRRNRHERSRIQTRRERNGQRYRIPHAYGRRSRKSADVRRERLGDLGGAGSGRGDYRGYDRFVHLLGIEWLYRDLSGHVL